MKKIFSLGFILTLWAVSGLQAQSLPHPTSTSTVTQLLEKIQVLKLENENLKLKLKMAQWKLSQRSSNLKNSIQTKPSLRKSHQFQARFSDQTARLAQKDEHQRHTLVIDFVNGEMWYGGVRYGINELTWLAKNQKWSITKQLIRRNPWGIGKYLYQMKNVRLIKYSDEKQGVFKIQAPQRPGDFKFITIGHLSFASTMDEVRTRMESPYFVYDREFQNGQRVVLKYKHALFWKFSQQLEFVFNRRGRLVEVQYGRLGQH
jgi:hypothetical protein